LVAGDFNGDKKVDLAFTDSLQAKVIVLLGDGYGSFPRRVLSPTAGKVPERLALGDFNADGHLDVAVTSYFGGTEIEVLPGNGDGSFRPHFRHDVGGRSRWIAVGDLNRDGKLDLAVAGSPAIFSIPDSTVLFGQYNEVRVVTPAHSYAIKPPVEVGYNHGYFVDPTISPCGDLVAWGFATEFREGHSEHAARFALGVFSLATNTWKTFGDFDGIGIIGFSSDGSKIAFVATQQNRRQLLIFDVAKETMTNAPYPKGMPGASLGAWSPDGKRLAIEIQRGEKGRQVEVLDLATGNVQSLGEGFNPAWSPSGEWIAYFDPSGAECLVVHPDGSGAKVVRKLRQSWFSYRRFGEGGPVWSPDGKRILLNEMKGDGDYIDVMLVDLESGRATRKAKNGLPVYGWASLSK